MRWVIDYPANIEVQSRYPTIVSVCVIFTSLMVAVVACRFYARNRSSRGLWVDDYIILLTTVCPV